MYTAKLLSDVKNIDVRRRILNYEFTNGEQTINKEFQFSITEEADVIKRTINQYVDELNFEPEPVTDLVVSEQPTETPEEIAKREFEAEKSAWLEKKRVLSSMVEDMEKGKLLGITPSDEQMLIMQNLANEINSTMKQEYYF